MQAGSALVLLSARSTPKTGPRIPAPIAAWILGCAFLNCAGWILSALHQLNARGYLTVFLVGMGAAWRMRRRIFPAQLVTWNWGKLRRRFGRPFPLAFLALALLATLGGALYQPTNYDALAYRTPRVLHWLAEGHWHWIHTEFQRLNTRATGFEWVSAPIFVFARTDRFLFVLNVISLGLLPGLVFSLFTR